MFDKNIEINDINQNEKIKKVLFKKKYKTNFIRFKNRTILKMLSYLLCTVLVYVCCYLRLLVCCFVLNLVTFDFLLFFYFDNTVPIIWSFRFGMFILTTVNLSFIMNLSWIFNSFVVRSFVLYFKKIKIISIFSVFFFWLFSAICVSLSFGSCSFAFALTKK